MSFYELAILGNASTFEKERLTQTIGTIVKDFELVVGDDVQFYTAQDIKIRNPKLPFAVAYFSSIDSDDEQNDLDLINMLVSSNVPIIPVIRAGGTFKTIPSMIQKFNGLQLEANDPEMIKLASALLECIGLLRKQRRIFISYKRSDSSSVALQLHDVLSSKGFDVFLDTHDIRPGDPFQDVLWHRLVDSDIMLMLDTPGYFDSRWTREEFGKAIAKEIHVLHIIWPNHVPSQTLSLAEKVYLESSDFDEGFMLTKHILSDIILKAESLRSRSIASRYLSVTSKLRAEISGNRAVFEGIGAHRSIGLRLKNGKKLWAYPIVGIPNAETLNDISNRSKIAGQCGKPILVYDHIGLMQSWLDHLNWLDTNLRVVRALKVTDMSWKLEELEEDNA